MTARRALGLLLACGLLACAGCSGDAARSADDRSVTVLAAASLTEPFTALEQEYAERHPDVDLQLVFGSSATLAGQVVEGGNADVLATADNRTMDTAVGAGLTSAPPRRFATNTMVLAVPADNPAGIESFAAIDDPGVVYVACVPSAPCGAVAGRLIELNAITTEPRSYEVDVRAVLSKVRLGEVDAGIVYASDVASTAGVTHVEIPGAEQVPNEYLLAPVEQSAEPAQSWIDLVLSPRGQAVLEDAGFTPAAGTP